MPTINNILIDLKGREVFNPGDFVSGTWELDTADSLTVRGVRVALKGAAYTRWSSSNSKESDKIGHEKFTSQWKTVFGTKLGEDGPTVTLPAGKHKYDFRFQLPSDGLPSSYEGKFGAIRYWLMLEIDRPLFRFNIRRYKTITVLDNVDINLPEHCRYVGRKTEKKVSKALGLGDEGTVSLHAETDREGYCPGEKIALSVIVTNNSERDLGILKASLIQKVVCFAAGQEKTKEYILASINGKELKKGEKRNWNRQQLSIRAIPPSTRPRSCHIVVVGYYVKVFVDIPKLHGGDIYVHLPITMGTVPQGHSIRQQQGFPGTSAIPVVDASAAITYTRCNQGLETFDQGDSPTFPVMTYTPMCAYVPNFQLPPQPKPAPRAQTPVKASATPAPVVTKTPPGPSTARVSPQPSAPPMLEAPPSYEEAMAGIGFLPPEQPTEEKAPADPAPTETADPKRSCLIVLFPDKCLDGFRCQLEKLGKRLGECSGEIIALVPQVVVNRGPWPQQTSLAAFIFTTKDNAKAWFSEFDQACALSDVVIRDAVIGPTRETYEEEKYVFSLSLVQYVIGTTSQALRKCSELAKKDIVPIRHKYGGVSLLRSKPTEHLRGEWPTDDHVIALTQWQQMKDSFGYSNELKSDFTDYMELMGKCMKTTVNVCFQSEDLAFVQDKQDEGYDAAQMHED